MNFINLVFQKFNCGAPSLQSAFTVRPVSRVHVLYNTEPAFPEKEEQNIEAGALMARDMRTVVQHDVIESLPDSLIHPSNRR
ncbi:MAG TPA: hypothetical protein VKE72_01385 [Methylocella sp.]|nr:hypothetical protein [Methylocella sp.]